MKIRTMKKVYAITSVIWIVSQTVGCISMILCIGMMGTIDFFTIELNKQVPEFPIFIRVQPMIVVASLITWYTTSLLREVIRDEYRKRLQAIRMRRAGLERKD